MQEEWSGCKALLTTLVGATEHNVCVGSDDFQPPACGNPAVNLP